MGGLCQAEALGCGQDNAEAMDEALRRGVLSCQGTKDILLGVGQGQCLGSGSGHGRAGSVKQRSVQTQRSLMFSLLTTFANVN